MKGLVWSLWRNETLYCIKFYFGLLFSHFFGFLCSSFVLWTLPGKKTPLSLWTLHSISSVQLLSRVRLFATPWIAARQASLSITNSWRSLRLTSIESVMPSSHLNLSTPSPPAPNPSHHQSLFHSIRSLYCSGWNKKSFRKENSSGMIWILIGKRKFIRFSISIHYIHFYKWSFFQPKWFSTLIENNGYCKQSVKILFRIKNTKLFSYQNR